ncbi:hypothetical protein [Pedobacter glucosidilyticus]|uniref:hypothetical protein n=1 Tax=Pedobacter glucosidilyticus TaxID=1122941 RepID=UPI0026F11144|nr:hypothetical protein [Pedobacter glucosidilyticus]
MKKLIFLLAILGIAIYYIGRYDKPSPKTGEIIFDIPSLIGKDINEIVRISAEKKRLTDSDKDGYKIFTCRKNGWFLFIEYNDKTKKAELFNYCSDLEDFRQLNYSLEEIEDLLLIGNLNKNATNYKITLSDSWSEYNIKEENRVESFTGINVYPLN